MESATHQHITQASYTAGSGTTKKETPRILCYTRYVINRVMIGIEPWALICQLRLLHDDIIQILGSIFYTKKIVVGMLWNCRTDLGRT